MGETKINLCRICLGSNATLPLFENDADSGICDIQCKLSLCFKEKIEDIEGYPQYICQTCNHILDDACNLINKYKNTCRLLERGINILKKNTLNIEFSDNEKSEPEIIIENIKNECKSEDDDDYDNPVDIDYEPLKLNIKLENEEKDRVYKKRRNYSSKTKQITNKVATSILEGEFSWNGDKWCLNSGRTNEKLKGLPKPLLHIKSEKRQRIKIKIPKVKIPIPPKLCDLCGKVFNNADRLTSHKKRVHYRNPIKCSECPRILSSSYYLTRHMLRVHSENKKFICPICGCGFAFKGELTNHDRNVHNKHLKKVKKFKCQFCDKIYKCSKSVVVHERSAHTGQRPAVCSICGSSFYHEDYLKEHMRLHTGETPFKCPICSRGYAQRCNMKSHLRTHRVSELDAATLSKLRPNYLRLLKA